MNGQLVLKKGTNSAILMLCLALLSFGISFVVASSIFSSAGQDYYVRALRETFPAFSVLASIYLFYRALIRKDRLVLTSEHLSDFSSGRDPKQIAWEDIDHIDVYGLLGEYTFAIYFANSFQESPNPRLVKSLRLNRREKEELGRLSGKVRLVG